MHQDYVHSRFERVVIFILGALIFAIDWPKRKVNQFVTFLICAEQEEQGVIFLYALAFLATVTGLSLVAG